MLVRSVDCPTNTNKRAGAERNHTKRNKRQHTSNITRSESDKQELLMKLENTITSHLESGKNFVIATALRFIDDEGLIPKKFKNICDYAQSRFKFGRRATNTYLCASYVYESIIEDPSLEIPTNISHIRGLHRYPPEHRRQIWKSATSSNEPITEELVMAHAAKYEMELGAVDKRNEIYIGSELHAIMKKMVPEQIFDLDPASCFAANTAHGSPIAHSFYDEKLDGLNREWFGNVWLFPPSFNRDKANVALEWVNKAESKWKSGECQSCLILVEVYFGGELFQKAAQFPHVLITKELRFLGPGGKEISVQGSNFMIVYMGKNLAKFKVTFGQIGIIPGINSWASESPAFSMDQYVNFTNESSDNQYSSEFLDKGLEDTLIDMGAALNWF